MAVPNALKEGGWANQGGMALLQGMPGVINAAARGGNQRQPQAGSQFQRIPRFEPWQQQIFQQLGQRGSEGMQDPTKGFGAIAQQARTQFDTQTIPSIAERFTAMGGGQRSSAFEGALGQAGAGFHENLAAMESKYGMQNMTQLMQMLKMALTPQSLITKGGGGEDGEGEQDNWLKNLLSTLGTAGGTAAGAYFGQPMLGASIGGSLGNLAGSYT